MKSAFAEMTQKIGDRVAFFSMVTLLLLLASPCGAARSAHHPPLDAKRLLQAYIPHRRAAKRTVGDIQWSPDGRHACYTIDEEQNSENGKTWKTLFSIRRNGSHIRKLYRWQFPGSFVPDIIQWSPDGSRIVMRIEIFEPASSVNADGVQLIDIDPETQERRRLSRSLDGNEYTGSILNRPGYYSFSPNGKYLLLTLGCRRGHMTNKRLVRIDYATGKRKLLTPFRMAAFDAHWSPDSRHIVYIALPDYGDLASPSGSNQTINDDRRTWHQHLYIVDADGSRKRRLTAMAGYFEEQPAWIAIGSASLSCAVRRHPKNQGVSGLFDSTASA